MNSIIQDLSKHSTDDTLHQNIISWINNTENPFYIIKPPPILISKIKSLNLPTWWNQTVISIISWCYDLWLERCRFVSSKGLSWSNRFNWMGNNTDHHSEIYVIDYVL